MLRKQIGFAWNILPSWMRLRIIRVTQRKFTVSAAAIITNADDKVLLLNHVLRPFSGWGLPGGFLIFGEQPIDAIRRELREETGIELDSLEMFRVRTIGRHIEILFVARAVSDATTLSREILELGWFDVDALPADLPASQKAVIAEASKQKAVGSRQ